jgi:hypothetical protein
LLLPLLQPIAAVVPVALPFLFYFLNPAPLNLPEGRL